MKKRVRHITLHLKVIDLYWRQQW